MTWGPTHLGISTLLFLLIFPKSHKKWAVQNPKLMLLSTLFSILPDIDLILPIPHRSWTHSILVVLVVMLSCYVIPLSLKKLSVKLKKFIIISTFFWLSHILYDLTLESGASIGLFYPLDLRYYQLVLGLVILLSPIVFPTQIFYQLNPLTPNKGISSFFTNWTSEQRIGFFGTNSINYVIADVFIHLTLFLFYIKQIIFPVIHDLSYFKNLQFPRIEIMNSSFMKQISKTVTKYLFVNILIISLIFMLVFSSFGQGETYTDSDSSNVTFQVLSNQLTLYTSTTYTIPESSEAKVEVFLFPVSLNLTVSFGQFNSTFHSLFSEIIENRTKLFESRNTTYEKSLRGIKNDLNEVVPTDWTSTSPLQNNTLIYSFNRAFASTPQEVTLSFLLNSWSNDTYFQYNMFTKITYTISRANVLQTALVLILLSLVVEFAVLTYSYIQVRKISHVEDK